MSKTQFENMIQGKKVDDDEQFNKEFKFNETTGEYDKTNDWDETYIVLDELGIQLEQGMDKVIIGEEVGDDMGLIRIGGEEAAHSLQNYADFKEKDKNLQTGKFYDNTKNIKKHKEYFKRRHESEAKKKVATMINELLRKNGMNEINFD